MTGHGQDGRATTRTIFAFRHLQRFNQLSSSPKTTLGLYVQVPFCASKCSFCNFSSQVAPSGQFDRYCESLVREIAGFPARVESFGIGERLLDFPVDTLYMGGGTPTLLGAERLARIVAALRRRFQRVDPIEFTLEATPGSADESFLERAREFGVNRLSIGAQSFQDRELRAVGRLHSAADTRETVRRARRAGLKNLNLDLIAGLPHQTPDSWCDTLRAAVELAPEHVSVYLFEMDEKSRLGREALAGGARYHAEALPSDEFTADAYEQARELLERHGYIQYEISNFARPVFASRHNRKYWQLEPYVGFGAGAHSFDGCRRWANEPAVEAYEGKLERGEPPLTGLLELSPRDQIEEFFFLGLRAREGIDLGRARRRWGREAMATREARVAELVRHGWLEEDRDQVRLSRHAYLVSNEIFEQFLA